MSTEREDKIWKRKRIATTLVYLLQAFISALEISISYSTSWLYLKKVSNNSRYLGLYYGLSQSAVVMPAILFGNIIAHYADKYRRIRLLIMIVNILTLIGCVMYLIPNSPALVLLGRFFIGFNLTTMPLIVGEFARSYIKKELAGMLLWLRGVFVFGKAAGPLFIVLFLNTDVYIGTIHVGYDNISAVVIFCLVVLAQILVYLFATDLSKDYDLKDFDEKESTSSDDNESTSSNENQKFLLKEDSNENIPANGLVKEENENLKIKKKSSKQLFKTIIEDKDVFFIIISTLCHYSTVQIIVLVVPVIILENLHYYKSTVNVVMAAQLVSFGVMLLLLYLFKFKQVTNGLYSWILTIASLAITIIVSTKLSFTLNVVLLTAVLTFMEVAVLKLHVFFATTLASIVQSRHQSFMDSIRFQTCRVGSVVGSMIAAVSMSYITEVYGILIAISVILFFVTLYKRKGLMENNVRI